MKRQALIKARKDKNWSQKDLATKVGITRAYLANLERGEHDPSWKVAQALSNVLGKEMTGLLRKECSLIEQSSA